MPAVGCPFAECTYITDDIDAVVAAAQLNIHALTHSQVPVPTPTSGKQKAPKLNRPSISRGTSEEEWNTFQRKWAIFKNGTTIPQTQLSTQLWQCCDEELVTDLFRDVSNISTIDEQTLMKAIKRLAVISVAASVRRAEVLALRQDHGQPIRSFAAKVKGKAYTCAFSKECSGENCDEVVDYTDEIVKYVVLSGIVDEEIKRDILGCSNLDDMLLNDTISLIENKEMAARAMTANVSSGTNLAANSDYRHFRDKDLQEKLEVKTKCKDCDKQIQRFKLLKGRAGKSSKLKEFSQCIDCWKKNSKQNKSRYSKEDGCRENTTSALFDSLSSIATVNPAILTDESLTRADENMSSVSAIRASKKPIVLDHYIFDGTGGWQIAESKMQPSLKLRISVDKADYTHLNLTCPKMKMSKVSVITDTGAQSSLMGLKMFSACGFTQSSLLPVKRKMYAANNEGINILGAVFVRLAGTDSQGKHIETAEMLYVSDSTDLFYLSRYAMEQLQIIGPDFPRVGAAAQAAIDMKDSKNTKPPFSECGCYKRSPPPPRPANLPFETKEENIPLMKQWLLDWFASSTFNKCPHQPLPMMTGPPIQIHIDPNATPVAVHTPVSIPIHWRDAVKEQLETDVRLGVIERVELNTPTTWCHRALWTRKSDGSPRRVVDLQSLNKHCVRDTHHTVPPFKQARAIPPNTYKTVTDCWNGYHSVPVREEDRHLLTFITELGRFRYCVAPPGHLAANDGYTDRTDRIIADILRKTKCVDDTTLWDEISPSGLQEHWWRIIDYLELMAHNGIILNPEKFQFSGKEVDFAGFRVTEHDVKPLPKYLDAIRDFPRPKRITDIRAWFGLINQVAHYSKLTDIMTPFKPLLSPKTAFRWDDELENAFQQSKLELIEAIKHGVQIFDPQRKTCLSPDWSQTGIGYWLRQKYCKCDSDTPDCCRDGWKITLAGSRFLRKSEQNFCALEGEALAIVWALEDTKFFTLGCDNLVIATDHSPLTKIFGDRSLDEISNTRVLRLKQRTLIWRFKVKYVPGKSIPASDATSRYPAIHDDDGGIDLASDTLVDMLAAFRIEADHDPMEEMIVASARSSLNKIRAITWERVRDETGCDIHMVRLINIIQNGFPPDLNDLPPQLQSYWQHREKLSTVDDVVMYGDRVVVPPTLRSEVCESLHSAHQGVTSMNDRARATVFWPGISAAIQKTRNDCDTCWRIAPSQSHLPPIEPMVPTIPFEAVAADYCTVGGFNYLITVDRFTNWPDIKQIKPHSKNSGSTGLIQVLKLMFSTFGVPMELSSDGGPEFIAKETQDFLIRWGVRHRLSSAYHPRSNGRAEVAVKAMKRLLQDNLGPNGEINSEGYTRAILQFRNTPDNDSGISPSQVLFGKPMRDVLPVKPRTQIHDNDEIRPIWNEIWAKKEDALRTRFAKQTESLAAKTRDLKPLSPGDICRVQNQTGHFPKKWDRSGCVVQVNGNDQYTVKMQGSGRLTLRNRKFLRKMEPYVAPTWRSDVLIPNQCYGQLNTPSQFCLPATPVQSTPVGDSIICEQAADTTTTPQVSKPVHETLPARTLIENTLLDTPTSVPILHSETRPATEASEQTEFSAVTPLRPTRNKNTPAWHADYKMS